MFNIYRLLSLLILSFLISGSAEAAFTIKNGRILDTNLIATQTPEKHYELGQQAFKRKDWKEASKQFNIVSTNYPLTPFGQESYYFLALSYYELEEFDFANEAFSQYIRAQSHPQYFLESIWYKYCIAEKFKNGAKKHFFGTKQLPKWAPATSLALSIYDEVVAALPGHEIAAYALYSKGLMLWENRDYRSCIDAFQGLSRRFPKHELAPECYLLITKVYLEQSQNEFQNPDLLAFAEINVKRFQTAFPNEERTKESEKDVLEIKEAYARGLYETGQFYERIHKPSASLIYYKNAVNQFPDTAIAQRCYQRIRQLDPNFNAANEECTIQITEEYTTKNDQKPLQLSRKS